MRIFIAADHAGFALKEALKPFLTGLGHEVKDCGADTLVEGDDYPDIVTPCARKVAEEKGGIGVVIGASGQGEAMAVNRIPGIRAAVYYGEAAHAQQDAGGQTLGLLASARMHNDANILSLGARFLSEEEAKEAVRTFLETPFSGEERHVRRIEKLG